MRPHNIVKLLRAIELIARPQGAGIRDLGQELGIDRRSVYRLLDTMQDLGFPIYDERGEGKSKTWRFESGYLKKLPNLQLPELKLTVPEVISLYLAKSDMAALRGTEIGTAADSAFRKIGSLLPDNLFSKLDRVRTLFVSQDKDAKDYAGKEAIIEELIRATLEQKTCRVTYDSFSTGRRSRFRIDPLHVFERHGGLYAFVRTTDYGDIRILALERIAALKREQAGFTPPEDFDPEARLAEAHDLILDDPVQATIWFSADQAPYVRERKRYAGQWTDNPDGSLILRLTTSGQGDILRWVLSCGCGARILEPRELADAARGELSAALCRYGDEKIPSQP